MKPLNIKRIKNIRAISGLLIIALLLSVPIFSVNAEGVFGASYADAGKAVESSSKQIKDTTTSAPAITTPVSIKAAKIETIKPQSYSGKAKKPALKITSSGKALIQNQDYTLTYKNNKNPGTATVTVKGIGNYYGTKNIKFKIIIPVPKKFKVKNNQKKITVSWKKVSAVTGYKVYIASNRKFTKKKTIKNLKSRKKPKYSITTPVYKRTYYIKIRAYKTIKGKNYYSKYTKVKKLKTKNQKWIEVDLSKQKVYLKKGKKKLKTYIVSTGKKKTPTIKGTFYIYMKNPKHDMIGPWDPKKKAPEYVQPDVLWATYFKGGYAFHAAYWHNNFGHPMSHGCVNMKTKDAKYLYKWAPMGTRVVVHK